MRVIKVYGSLAKFLGQRSFKAAVNTPIEAIRFLLANFPQVESHIAENHYKISVGRNPLQIGDQPELLTYPTAEFEPIRIIPTITGAGASGGQIAAGIGLIALAILAGPAAGGFLGLGANAFAGTFTLGAVAAQAIGGIGLALTLGGVAGLMAPTSNPNGLATSGSDSASDPRKSFSFSGIQNVSRQGVPVPIVYGEVIVGSVVVSAGINTEEVAV